MVGKGELSARIVPLERNGSYRISRGEQILLRSSGLDLDSSSSQEAPGTACFCTMSISGPEMAGSRERDGEVVALDTVVSLDAVATGNSSLVMIR